MECLCARERRIKNEEQVGQKVFTWFTRLIEWLLLFLMKRFKVASDCFVDELLPCNLFDTKVASPKKAKRKNKFWLTGHWLTERRPLYQLMLQCNMCHQGKRMDTKTLGPVCPVLVDNVHHTQPQTSIHPNLPSFDWRDESSKVKLLFHACERWSKWIVTRHVLLVMVASSKPLIGIIWSDENNFFVLTSGPWDIRTLVQNTFASTHLLNYG